ncbi:MAG: HAD hydrolase-like protein, partial [Muribaculaceae bacterium]|nr:HAD hydrolase-like protein [Muribaculaceae bacterium]
MSNMNHFPILFFDLDGTIVDSGEGIMRCASHALHHYGIEEDWQQLAKFVGPPLEDSFIEFYG